MMFYFTLNAFVLFFSTQSLRPPIYVIMMGVLALMGIINGFVTMRLLKFFGLSDFIFSSLTSAIGLPLFIFTFLAFEVVLSASAGAYSRWNLMWSILMSIIWSIVNGFFCLVGAYQGYTMKQVQKPIKVHSVARAIPPQPTFMNSAITSLFFGFVQYLAICIEFSSLVKSVWRAKIYTLFGFLLVDFLLTVAVVCMLSVLHTYLTLQHENYVWWWRSFWTGASGGIYLLIYSVVFLFTEFDVSNFGSDAVYLIYMVFLIACYSLMAGTVSVGSSYVFVEHIYTDIRGD